MEVLEKGLRFQGEALWWLLSALLPSSQGSEPCSSGGRHTWLPARRKHGHTSVTSLCHPGKPPHGGPGMCFPPHHHPLSFSKGSACGGSKENYIE